MGGNIPVPPPVTRMTWSLKRPFSKTELYPTVTVKKVKKKARSKEEKKWGKVSEGEVEIICPRNRRTVWRVHLFQSREGNERVPDMAYILSDGCSFKEAIGREK